MAAIQEYSKIRYNGSAAYEIAYEPQQTEQEAHQQIQTPKAKKAVKASYSISLFAVVGFIAVAVVMVLVLMTYVQYTSVAAQTMDYRERIETLSEEQRRLTVKYEQTFDMHEIELYAKSTLGMDIPQTQQLGQVALNASDKAVVYAQEYSSETFIGGLTAACASLMEYFG